MTYEERKQIGEMRAAGMSYNRIADTLHLSLSSVKSHCQRHGLGAERPAQKAKPAEPKVSLPPTASSCEQCGGPVQQEPGRKHRRFCSDACRLAWWSAHRGEMQRKTMRPFTCAYCGIPFSRYGVSVRSYCSRSCAALARSRKESSHDA